MKFLIVDAFTETAFGGNPAGVVILPENADFSSDETMVKLLPNFVIQKLLSSKTG